MGIYIVEFAGVVLNNYCNVISKVVREVIPERENFSKQIPTMNGSYYTGYRYSERKISLEVNFNDKTEEKLNKKITEFANILDVSSPKKLLINDEPDIYYLAVPNGSFEIEKPSKLTATINIEFVCHNPLKLSKKWKSFVPLNKGIITFENEGTVKTEMIVDVDFNKDACFFQATNPTGETVLIGKPKDETKSTVSITDIMLEENCESSSKFSALAQSLLDNNRIAEGQFGVGLNGEAMICTNYGNTPENQWGGAAFKRSIGQNVEEFEVVIDFVFSSEGKNYAMPQPTPVPPNATTPDGTSLGTWKVVNCGGLYINETPDTSKPLYAMAPDTLIYPTEKNGIWLKHTHSNPWNTFTGWSSSKYLQKVSDSGRTREVDDNFAEEEMGILEVYGYDQDGSKLFKAEISDTNKYYEYNEPRIFFGNSLVVDDGKNAPSPRKITSGENNEEREVESGVFGDWNDCDGKFVIRREKNQAGQYLWSASVYKYQNGQIVRTMSTSNSLSSSSYPKGALNYLGFFIGRFGGNRAVDVMAIKNIHVRKLNMKNDVSNELNESLFKKGDHLQVNFASGQVTINGLDCLTNLDIGSEFFSIPSGRSQVAIRTDDDTASVVAGIQEKYI